MRYATVCSGIEAPSVAWEPLGWKPVWFSEIEPFPCEVLRHRFPRVPNLGDMTKIGEEAIKAHGTVDLLCGGTPCQSFSVAGLREGLDDARGNLALRFVQLAALLGVRWVVWENVPGVLSSNKGRDFGSILGALAQLGYGLAYRVLDAQFFRVPQRRRRVFVVGYLGDWRRAQAVLFESPGVPWNPPPRGEAGEVVAPTLAARTRGGGGLGTDFDIDGGLIACPEISPAMKARDSKGPSSDGDGDGLPLVAYAFAQNQLGEVRAGEIANTIGTNSNASGRNTPRVMASNFGVRRLTPRECERLQGFPDDWTLIPRGKRGKPAKDGPRYKAIGNSMAVPVLRWIGERIQSVEAIG